MPVGLSQGATGLVDTAHVTVRTGDFIHGARSDRAVWDVAWRMSRVVHSPTRLSLYADVHLADLAVGASRADATNEGLS